MATGLFMSPHKEGCEFMQFYQIAAMQEHQLSDASLFQDRQNVKTLKTTDISVHHHIPTPIFSFKWFDVCGLAIKTF